MVVLFGYGLIRMPRPVAAEPSLLGAEEIPSMVYVSIHANTQKERNRTSVETGNQCIDTFPRFSDEVTISLD